ncbi:MAG TPA: hypothetical protein DCL41_10695, partial [Bdellovibrionales bacterium]|nr:hypothetical protein [Bdellovibrionales bacterium]
FNIFCESSSMAYNPGKHFLMGSKAAFTNGNQWIWASGATLTAVALIYDQDIYKHYEGKPREKFPEWVGGNMGTGIPGAVIALATMGYGWSKENAKALGAGTSHAEALVATFIYTTALKASVNRNRPPEYHPGSTETNRFNASFPSGHTSTAFATAGNLMATCGPWVGVPALALAGITGYSRVQQRAHYLADVIFGATLGYTMGVGFYEHHNSSEDLGWQVLPIFEDRDSWKVTVSRTF